MTPEQLDEARAKEALRIWDEEDGVTDEDHAVIAARLAREGWTPPEPVVDPDLLAFREWRVWTGHDPDDYEPLIGHAYMAGARMAREQEREQAKEVVDRLSDLVERVTYDGKRDYVTNVNAGEMISARVVLANYRGEA